MNKVYFRNDLRSYIKAVLMGIGAGLLVAFFSRFPHDDLWGLALFSSQTFGFWIFSCSLIAQFSEKNHVAGSCVALYVYFMFYVTGIFKRLAIVAKGYNQMAYFWKGLYEELTYGLPYALVCFFLGFIMWHGRKDHRLSLILRYAPALFISAELIALIILFLSARHGLFMLINDAAYLIAYLVIIIKQTKTAR